MDSSIYICQLNESKQNKIKKLVTTYLIEEGYPNMKIKEIISNVMDDRLWNIEEIIDISQF